MKFVYFFQPCGAGRPPNIMAGPSVRTTNTPDWVRGLAESVFRKVRKTNNAFYGVTKRTWLAVACYITVHNISLTT